MNDLVLYYVDGDVAVITVNNPPVNALSPGVPEGIAACLQRAQQDDRVRAVVLIGAGRSFIAGADIKEFGKITSGSKARGEGLHPLLYALEDSPKPVTAAIHGQAFGGGLEVAMACAYRVAVPEARLGQPEVKLGLIPGAGGTQRLPRLVGVAKAIEMCQFGEPVSASEAARLGLVDQLVEGDLVTGAVAFARRMADQPVNKVRQRDALLGTPEQNSPIFARARELAQTRQRDLIAPRAAIEAIEAATKLPFYEGIQQEAQLFEQCLFSSQSKALIHVFFAERAAAKIPDLPKDTPVQPVQKAGIVGAGTMGVGIAMTYANAGIPVVLKDVSQQALDRALAAIQRQYAQSVAKGRFSQAVMEERLGRIQLSLDDRDLEEADIVVEAVFENMALKKEIFSRLDQIAKPGAILATNTSTLSIDEIAAATSRPHQVVGHHFFSPAHVMRLLEIVRGRQTSLPVLAASLALARRLGKVAVVVGNCRGFVGNRMFGPYRREAQFLIEEGASVEQVDRAMTEFGMAMGPLAVGDLAGLDVGWRIRREFQHLDPPGVRKPLLEDRLVEKGRLGQKSGAGWYRYDENRKPYFDPAVDEIIDQVRREAGIQPRLISQQEITERLLYTLVNEGARILEEKIALRSSDIDIVYVYGYGFPAHRGGPMFYADSVGLSAVLERVREFHAQHGSRWQPAPLLERLAGQGRGFSSIDTSIA
ncbi:MAG: 3-hydroxyacyl-CoA dehydrogenase NAD-binding domain-containing protein [Bryobacteraceae bacterium]|nr:3-hydroxyacyl-CoA dehydrogenase NAD-binding domain-containing protein [Bryobacteraceae bacterium]MDW8380361.1 3-hydroxyacyl-CoA dehydrogenase NAD-binding domain-containing protein [Bryobacterales bacterium]